MPKPIDQKDRVAIDIPLDVETSRGNLTTAGPAQRNAVGPGNGQRSVATPGRRAAADETVASIARYNGQMSPEFMAAMGTIFNNIQNLIPEEEIRAQQVGQAERLAEGMAALGENNNRHGQRDGAIDEPPPTQNLPAVVNQFIFDPNRRTEANQNLHINPRWHNIFPMVPAPLRALGQRIFSTLPCFDQLVQGFQRRGARPAQALDQVRAMSNIGGGAFNSNAEMDAMANWIRRNGLGLDGMQVQFPELFENYAARVTVAVSEDTTFLLVEDRNQQAPEDGFQRGRAAYGAPVNAYYIYSWPGGRGLYLNNPQAAQRLADLSGAKPDNAPRPALPAPAGHQPQPAAVQPAANQAQRLQALAEWMRHETAQRGETIAQQAERIAANPDAVARQFGLDPAVVTQFARGAAALGQTIANGGNMQEGMAAARGALAEEARRGAAFPRATNAADTKQYSVTFEMADGTRQLIATPQAPMNAGSAREATALAARLRIDYQTGTVDGRAVNRILAANLTDGTDICQLGVAEALGNPNVARPQSAAPERPAPRRPAQPRPAVAPIMPQKAGPSAMATLHAAGFSLAGTDTGPALRKHLEDGRIAQVTDTEKKTLANAKSYEVAIYTDLSEDPEIVETCPNAQAVVDLISNLPAPARKM
jgi:hypothetical protein